MKSSKFKRLTLAVAALTASAICAQAATISPASGLDLTRNVTESNAVQVFSEAAGVTVGAGAVKVDYVVGSNLAIGATATGFDDLAGTGLSLAAGTYDSYLVHFDPLNGGSISASVVDFGSRIVALILTNSSVSGNIQLLKLSDATFGTAAIYDSHIGRRTESTDTFMLTNASTLSLNLLTNSSHVDNIRVLTEVAAVPLPATLPLLLAGFGGLMLSRRKRRESILR